MALISVPPCWCLYVTHATRAFLATTYREKELTLNHIHTFLTNKDMEDLPGWVISSMLGPPPRLHKHERWYTSMHAPIHCKKANMKGWLWRPNDTRGHCRPKASWHLSYRWGKTPKKSSPRKLVPTGNRTWARWVICVHATAYSTVVAILISKFQNV